MGIFNYDAENEMQRCLGEIREVVDKMPYSRGYMLHALNRLCPSQLRSKHIESRVATNKCRYVYEYFSSVKDDPLVWVREHEVIRQMILLLSSPPTHQCNMDGQELLQWCEKVFTYLRREISFALNTSEPHRRQQQVCINALHDLVEVVRASDDKARILSYYEYLIKLCQKTSLFPQQLVIPYPVILSDAVIETRASARVYHGLHNDDEVAIKEFRLYSRKIPPAKKRFLKEAYITKVLHHPNIIPFIGIVQEEFRLCIVMPWMKNGDVNTYLAKNSHFEISLKKELLEQVADGLHFVHQYGFAHGDLKGSNVLISDEGKALTSDFGIATLQEDIAPAPTTGNNVLPRWRPVSILKCKQALKEGGMSQEFASTLLSRLSNVSGGGTYRWMAPELFMPENFGLDSAKATFASDVFSFGMLAIEIYTGQPPHPNETKEMAFLHTISGRYPKQPPDLPDSIWPIISDCWKKHNERPSISDIYNTFARLE